MKTNPNSNVSKYLNQLKQLLFGYLIWLLSKKSYWIKILEHSEFGIGFSWKHAMGRSYQRIQIGRTMLHISAQFEILFIKLFQILLHNDFDSNFSWLLKLSLGCRIGCMNPICKNCYIWKKSKTMHKKRGPNSNSSSKNFKSIVSWLLKTFVRGKSGAIFIIKITLRVA